MRSASSQSRRWSDYSSDSSECSLSGEARADNVVMLGRNASPQCFPQKRNIFVWEDLLQVIAYLALGHPLALHQLLRNRISDLQATFEPPGLVGRNLSPQQCQVLIDTLHEFSSEGIRLRHWLHHPTKSILFTPHHAPCWYVRAPLKPSPPTIIMHEHRQAELVFCHRDVFYVRWTMSKLRSSSWFRPAPKRFCLQ